MSVEIKADIRHWLRELDKKYFFVMLGFAVMVHAYTGQTRGAQARPFVLGLATAALLLIKISDIPGLGVMVLF